MAVYDVAKQLIAISPDIPDETAQVLDQHKDPGAPRRHRRGDRRSVARRARVAARRGRRGRAAAAPAGAAAAQGGAHQGEAEDRLAGARGVLQAPARGGAAPEAEGDPGRARRGRGRQRPRRVRREDQGGRDARGGREDGAQAARSPEADGAVVGRVHRPAHLPRVAGRAAVVEADRGPARAGAGARHPRRRPLRPQEGEEAHPRVPGGAQAGAGQEGADPLPRRASRRRQDLARQVDRPLARARVHPHLARRRARRGRDPRPPAHVHRRAAGPDHPGHAAGRDQQPGLHARRDRQAGRRFPRRPVGRAARGAGPRAELDLLRSLPGGELRSVGRHLHRDGEHARSDPAGAARPHGGAGDPRLHPRGEAGDRSATWCPSRSPSTGSTSSGSSSPTKRSTPSSSSTRARPACATWSARSPTSSARGGQGRREPDLRSEPSPATIAEFLGPQKFYSEAAERTEIPGVATGLAWTPTGGDILFIEASR